MFGGFNQTSGTATDKALGAGPKSSTIVQDPSNIVMLAEADVNPTNAEQVTPTVNSVQAAFSACIRIQDPWYNTRWNASKAGTFPSSTAGRLGVHHAGGMNTIWADGHAKWTKNPPEDCHSYISGMPAGAKSIRTAPATDVCRPAGSDVGFCYTQ